MSTFSKLTYHVIFSTKFRKRLIDDAIQERLYEYVGGIIRTQDGHLIQIGGVEDHIHLLANMPPTKPVSDLIREIKSSSSKWLNEWSNLHRFEWQKGYGAFTVSYSQIDSVRQYIQNQRQHHQNRNFEEEYIAFLRLHQLAFDQKYLFENEHHG